MTKLDYRSAGVDLDTYEQSMRRLPALMHATRTAGVIDLEGGFAGLFRLAAVRDWTDPILVSGSDGVGTKLRVAIRMQVYSTVGIDLVAMCVNDCLCLGATPLFFLDYIAMEADDPELLEQLVRGISSGCQEAGAALLGGETAIMPDMYTPGEFDLSGFSVGAAERTDLILGRDRIRPGDVVIGLPSSGVHSNGFSLVRRVVFDHAKLDIESTPKELGGRTVGEVLLTPTRIYAAPVAGALTTAGNAAIHGIAHITGGGIAQNLERILPTGVRVQLSRSAWSIPKVFSWLQLLGGIADSEMDRVFNMGIGMVIVADPSAAETVRNAVSTAEHTAVVMGEVLATEPSGPRKVIMKD